MELVLALLAAGPIGYLTSTRRKGLVIYLAAWAVVFPIQSVIVGVFSDDLAPLYLLLNAIILAGGLASLSSGPGCASGAAATPSLTRLSTGRGVDGKS